MSNTLPKNQQKPQYRAKWRNELYDIIFEADTFWGKDFDVALLVAIVLSVLTLMLESVREVNELFGFYLRTLEWIFTILFTLEYLLRIITIDRPVRYIFSFFGIVDFLSIVPTYLGLFFFGSQSLIVIRTLGLLRVFRILKIAPMLGEARQLSEALRASHRKIIVFLLCVLSIVVIMGTIMYLIEDAQNGFTSIPRSIYWAIVTLTAVGYGAIAPQTVLGQFFAATIMILGYSILAVPTGIVSAEMAKVSNKSSEKKCPQCTYYQPDTDADFCKYCGGKLV